MTTWEPAPLQDLSPEASFKQTFAGTPSPERRKSGSGRFLPEELTCFKRVPTLSQQHSQKKAESMGDMSRAASASSLTPVQPSKDDDLLLDEKQRATIAQEDELARVLEQIYPRSVAGEAGDLLDARPRDGRRARRPTSSPNSPEAGQQSHQKPKVGMPGRFLQFRQKILDKFQTMKNAFDTFTHASPSSLQKELTRKEFSRFLNKYFKGLSPTEHENIFDFLDQDKNGTISLAEFHTAVEASAPVRSIEDLRRKLIALGYTSMRQTILLMDGSYEKTAQSSSRRLNFTEFAAALSRIGIADEEEQQAIFNAIIEPTEASTVSLDELSSAIAAVSPPLLLEDLRDRLLKKFGTLHMAYEKLDLDFNERLTSQEFARHAVNNLRMTQHEAMRAFAIMDLDGNNWISRSEFISALRLSEPALFLEDLRRKVRQRFRSIRDAFALDESEVSSYEHYVVDTKETKAVEVKASEQKVGKAFRRNSIAHKDTSARSATELYPVLSTVMFTEADTRTLFDLVDVDSDGKLTSLEFVRGIRLFAPSCVLEDLRLRCLRHHSRFRDAFKHISSKRREAVMDLKGFEKLLQDLRLDTGVDVAAVFYLVETRRDGGLGLGELFAALHSGSPGMQIPLPPDQRDAKARQQVKWQMAPFHRSAGELRSQMRQPAIKDEAPVHAVHTGNVNDPRSYVTSSLYQQKRLAKSSPDLRQGTSPAPSGISSSTFASSFGSVSPLGATAPASCGFGLSTLAATDKLLNSPTAAGPSMFDNMSRTWGRSSGRSSPSSVFGASYLRDSLTSMSPRTPLTPSKLVPLEDASPEGSSKKGVLDGASDMANVKSPLRQRQTLSPRTPLKRRDSMLHVPTKQSYKKLSNLLRVMPSAEHQPMLDRLEGYYMNAGQTIADDANIMGSTPLSRMKQFQVASYHHAALARSV